MTEEERISLFDQMLDLPELEKYILLSSAFTRMGFVQDNTHNAGKYAEEFFEHVAYVIDKHMEGELD